MNYAEIKKIINSYYGIKIKNISLFSRKRIDYEKNKDRKIYNLISVDGNYYILKVLLNKENTNYIELLFENLKQHKFLNTVYPIKNKLNRHITKYYNIYYLLFPYYDFISLDNYFLKYIDVKNIFISYKKMSFILNEKLIKKNISNFYINNIDDFIFFVENSKKFFILLYHYNINPTIFFLKLKYYKKILDYSHLKFIYGSFWHGNIFLYKNYFYFIDLDSFQIGDMYYDMYSILLFIFINYKDNFKKRYKLYNEIFFYFTKKQSIDKSYLEGLIYYCTFRRYIDVYKGENIKFILKDINSSFLFSRDFLFFLKYYKGYTLMNI